MPIDKSEIDPVVEADGDKAHRVARAALSAIPGVGGAAVELFSSLIEPPLERRKREWMIRVTEALNRLEQERGIDLEQLKENDAFFTCLVQASQVALRNHQEEKIEALANAVVNAALPTAPNESLQQVFLNFVDTFTVWHLKILDLFQDPQSWALRNEYKFRDMSMGGRSHVLEMAFPELQGKRDFYDMIWSDLYQRRLVGSDSLHVTMSGTGLFQGCVSNIGNEFLFFIRAHETET